MSIDQNKFWKEINEKQLSPENIEANFENFKSSSINHKLALFNPEVNGVRYLKTVNFLLASTLSSAEIRLLGNTKNRDLGNPLCIQYKGMSACLDYLQAAKEVDFIQREITLENSSIIEIGAGYGRTCHTLLSNFDIEQYCIIDLPNALQLSRRYLSEVLGAPSFKKITFISVAEFDASKLGTFDLAINIDSFAEMDKEVVHEYLAFIDKHCTAFYAKNPVGKYYDQSLDGHSQGNEVIELALKQGVLTDILDIDNQSEVNEASKKFLLAYKPSAHWTVKADSWAVPFSYIWQSLFAKENGA
ncbi:MAG: putative sugar O-methyltransferase [Flavobacteriales bacterium]|nr:putative sugar O-methyltransferase [Gammaproteobacteria bacterium]MBL4667915.1 putative sugar O-methyltransferase [Flavobacteriales bacterium]